MQKQISFFIFTLVAAALAGTAAAVLVSNSLERYAESLLNDRRFAALAPIQHSATPTTLEEALGAVKETQLNSEVFFIDDTTTSAVVLMGDDFVHGKGMMISADGWILTSKSELSRYITRTGSYAGFVVLQGGKTFIVDKIEEDTQTDAVAIRVQNAQGWTAVELAESDEVFPGGTVFGLGTTGEVYTTSTVMRSVQGNEAAIPAEEPRAFWTLSSVLPEGTAIIDTQNRLFGFVNEDGLVVPAQALRPFIRQALRGADIVHAALGATVIDLSEPSSLSLVVTQGYREGILIAPTSGERTGVVKDGAADSAGLTDGDIILAIDDVRITATTTSADIFATYAPGQEVTLRVARSGEVEDMRVTLGTWEELVY
jgi:S1-C subfamily serine protease